MSSSNDYKEDHLGSYSYNGATATTNSSNSPQYKNGIQSDIENAAAGGPGMPESEPIVPSHRYAGLPDGIRNHVIAMVGEFVGTFMFLLFAELIANNANLDPSVMSYKGPSAAQITMISFGFGFSVMACVFVFYRISGGQLNPAVSLTLMLCRVISPIRFAILFITQMIAGMAAAAAADALTPGKILFANSLGDNVNRTRGLFLEMFATALLCMTVLFMAVEKHRATYIGPLAIGVSLFIGHLFCVPNTGAGINPARSFGPCIADRSFPTYHWIYWVGPFMGSFLAAGLHYLLKFLHYETCNPGQDSEY